tara:strand:+ start:335 stop:1087 length:753 start_codon:yes stop_codon:yes gene_type:complete
MKVYLAGASTGKKYFYNGASDFVLMSFMESKSVDFNKIKCESILLDSGAFTFMNSRKNSKIDWDEYIDKYSSFINKYNIKLFFELDIDSLVGLKEVERLRSKLERQTNKKSIPVWHKSRGLKYWENMCQEYNYISIGGIVTKEIKQTEYKFFAPMLKIAKENNCKVHALGFTRTRKLHLYKFYSVDSTNWITTRFNIFYKYDNINNIMQSQKKINNTNNKLRVSKEKRDEYNIFQIKEWVKFQKYADENL